MAARKPPKRKDLTWDEAVGIEPRLASLLESAQQTDGSGEHFCANRVWYRELKPILCELVGWSRKRGPYVMTTSAAYLSAASDGPM